MLRTSALVGVLAVLPAFSVAQTISDSQSNTGALGSVTITATGQLVNRGAGTIADATNDGRLINDGTSIGPVINSNVFDNRSLTTSVTQSDGVTLNTGTIGSVTLNGGRIQNQATGTVTGPTVSASGTNIRNFGTLADVTNGGEFTQDSGSSGAVTNTGEFNLNGGTAASLSSAGTAFNATNGTVLGDVISEGSGVFVNLGTINGDLTNRGSSDASLLGGQIDGALSNEGSATMSISSAFTGIDAISQTSSGVLSLSNAAVTLEPAGTVTNSGPMQLSGSSITGATLSNTSGATFTMDSGSSLTMDVTNDGDATMAGTVNGSFVNNGTLTVGDTSAYSSLDINGAATLNGTINFDTDLSGVTSNTDVINVSGGALSGDVVLSFANGGQFISTFTPPIDLITYDSGSTLSFSSSSLSNGGIVSYILDDDGSAITLEGVLNPGIGGLAGGIVLTQSLISSVVNRPSSAFVTGSVTDQTCTSGGWSRVTGGRAEAEGDVSTAAGTFDNEVTANYYGMQFGYDQSCNDLNVAGFDLTFGATAGANFGDMEQPVYAVDPLTGATDTSLVTSRTNTDFTQYYAGAYVGLTRDRLFADLQLRFEQTQYSVTNEAEDGAPLGVSDQDYNSYSQNLSGSLGYAFALNEERGINFVPTVGFSITRTDVDNIQFDNGTASTSDDGTLEIDNFTSQIGFLSAALSKTSVAADGTSALSYFATGTIYNDFSEDVKSTFDPGQGLGTFESEAQNLGTYSELSLGLNYTKVLDRSSAPLNASRLDASVRVDGRYSDRLDSWGLTAQARIQF